VFSLLPTVPGFWEAGGAATGFPGGGAGTRGLTDTGKTDAAERELADDMGCTSAVAGLKPRDIFCLNNVSS